MGVFQQEGIIQGYGLHGESSLWLLTTNVLPQSKIIHYIPAIPRVSSHYCINSKFSLVC